MFFIHHQLMNIKNKNYIGPLQKQLSDIMYTKHTDIKYTYNILSHLGILECLTKVSNRQSETSKARDDEKEVESIVERTFVELWFNFCKFHAVIDPVYGNSQTTSNDILNVTLLGLPPPSSCELCSGNECVCTWAKGYQDKNPPDKNHPDINPRTKTPLPKTPRTKTPQRKLINTKYILHK